MNFKRLLPIRKSNQNKTHGGKTLIIAGSKGFYGAAILAATSAARVGSGYTTLMCHNFPTDKHPDFLIKELKLGDWNQYNSIAVGPGLGVHTKTESVIRSLIKNKIKNVVLDADAITVVANKKIFPLPASWILTPHTGELTRLIGKTGTLKKAQLKYGCHLLLKGAKTKIVSSTKLLELEVGNSSLAKAGTGDVLTGIIAGLLAQGLSPFDAAALGAYIHGCASKVWTKKGRDHLSLLASDLFEIIPEVLHKIRTK